MNEELKKKFFEENPSMESYQRSKAFTIGAEMERMYNKDLSNFSYEEIEQLLRATKCPSVNSLRVYLTGLRRYTDYCIEKGIVSDGINHYDSFYGDLIPYINKAKIQTKYITKEEVFQIIHDFVNTMDKVLFLGAYEGLDPTDEIIEIRQSDIDTKAKTVTTPLRTIEMSKEFINLACLACEETEYYFLGGREGARRSHRPFVVSDYCIKESTYRSTDRKTLASRRLYALKKVDAIPNYLTYTDFQKSGAFAAIESRMKELNMGLELLERENRKYIQDILERWRFKKRYDLKQSYLERLGEEA